MLRYVLLGALSYQPLTGYQLKQFVDSSAKHFWYAQVSQIYRTLDGLEKEGFLRSEIETQEDRPDRRLYHLTPAGRADLLAWLAQPMTEIETEKDTLLVRLFFSALIDKTTLLTQLRLQRTLRQQQLTLYQTEILEQIRLGMERRPDLKRDALLWDAAPLPSEKEVELVIGMQPTSALIRRGHCLRVAHAGADKDTFARIPAVGTPQWKVRRA
ncbi:MAG TPA: helix-turn-helix transcriptional regulator, partial [Aggregatilineales bacterium]|nr:helix-turn-helix transcriptional regulator [Aggregatilineales bacterium]